MQGMKSLRKYYWVVLALLSFSLSLNSQSFWIDECCTALCAMQQNIAGCWQKICQIGGSDAQIAFYYYLLFLWHHLTGTVSELGLRLFNVLWVILAAWWFRKEPKALILLLFSPFFIYYACELRPYILQIAASCAVSMQFCRTAMGKPLKFHALLGSLFFLCLTSLSSVVWALGFVSAFCVLAFRQFRGPAFRKAALVWAVPFAALAAYYVFTLSWGARAVFISSNWITNVAASAYELSGLAGIGPSRLELRGLRGMDSLWGMYGLEWGISGGLVILAGTVYGIILWNRKGAGLLLPALLALLLVPGAVFLYGTEAMDFRFSGRHCAPLLPVLCLVWSRLWPERCGVAVRFKTVLFLLMVAVWSVSSFRIRFHDSYEREDYRGAVHYCCFRKEGGVKIFLSCNDSGKEFYGWLQDSSEERWDEYDEIVVSRRSEYASFLHIVESSGAYECSALCQGFVVCRRRGPREWGG